MTQSFLRDLQEAIDGEAAARLRSSGLSEEQVAEALASAIKEIRGPIAKDILRTLKRRSKAMLRDHRCINDGFEKRTFQRWKPAFDLFEMILVIAHEVGAEHDAELRPEAVKTENWKFEAVSHLHARGLLIAHEIYSLLRGGFADGALARWRTLHELSVTAMFIHQNDSEIAFRYLASFRFASLRAAHQLNAHAERAGIEPFSQAEIDQMEQACIALEQQLGERLKKDYDWARPALAAGKVAARQRDIAFHQIEEKIGLDHWRPHYRWASQHNHASHRPMMQLLGASEATKTIFLVGASNSGFVDPLHLAATSLQQLFATFLLLDPNFDRLVITDIVHALVDELGHVALEVEKTTLSEARSNSGARWQS